jgi:microcystin-dependent protein
MKKIFLFVFIITFLCFIKYNSNSQIPGAISYQGILTDQNGKDTLAHGTYKMTFEIYDQKSDGTAIWSEAHDSVEVSGGLFSVYLGGGKLIGGTHISDLAFDKQYFLKVSYKPSGASGVFSFDDRLPFATSPYAFNTKRIDGNQLDAKTPKKDQVLKYDGQNWTPQNDSTGGNFPTLESDSGIVVTTGTNTIRITGVNIKANSPIEITSSNGILTINLNKVPLSKIDNGNAQKGQTLKWNGAEWAPAFDMPIGTVVAFAGEDVQLPDGWLYCDGSAYLQSDYQDLYKLISLKYGNSGANSNYFSVPDYRGLFLRGVDTSFSKGESKGYDPDRHSRIRPNENATATGNRVGSLQMDAITEHYHFEFSTLQSTNDGSAAMYKTDQANRAVAAYFNNSGGNNSIYNYELVSDPGGVATGGLSSGVIPNSLNISTESRPKNAYVNWIIKAK